MRKLVLGVMAFGIITMLFFLVMAKMTFAFTSGDCEYLQNDGNVEIVGFIGTSSSIVIPNKIDGYPVTSIGVSGFTTGSTSRENLISVFIPDSVTNIGKYAFRSCYNLKSISVSPDNAMYTSIDGVVYNKLQTTLIHCPAGKSGTWFNSYTFPDSVTSIGAGAFYGCQNLSSFIIPNNITSIDEAAFGCCYYLDEVTIGSSVTSIGEASFSNCSNLMRMTIPNLALY